MIHYHIVEPGVYSHRDIIRLHPNERRIRIEVLYYPDRIVRKLKITDQRMRDRLGKARVTNLPDLPKTMNTDEVFHDCRRTLIQIKQALRKTTPVIRTDEVGFVPMSSGPVARDIPMPKGWTLTGILAKYGYEKKHDCSGNSFKQFCIHVTVPGESAPKQVWGADLRRALRDSGAVIGDEIDVRSLGVTTATRNEKTVQKDGTEIIEPKVVQMKSYEIVKRRSGDPEAA
jgi:hypothetical protein